MGTTLTTPRLFSGKTVKIHTPNQVEVAVDLDFDIVVRKIFKLDRVSDDVDPEFLRQAQYCLVVLLGGKRVLVEPSVSDREQWGRKPVVRARLFLAEKIYGSPIGLMRNLPDTRAPVLEISPFLNWLREHKYAMHHVKAALNGTSRNGKR